MNSKQINFFLTPDDLPAVNDFLSNMNCVVIKRHSLQPEQPVKYDLGINQDELHQVCLCRPEDLTKLVFVYLDNREEYYIDTNKSNCVEFSLGGFYMDNEKELHSSRLYFTAQFFIDGGISKKDEGFINWADGVFKSFKKRFLIKDKDLVELKYVTENFIKWVNEKKAFVTPDESKFIIA